MSSELRAPFGNPERTIFVFVLLAASTAYAWLAWLPLERLVGLFVGDDMFYYLQIARNISRGLGATFDGSTWTNGFHPVYMSLLSLLFWLVPGQAPTFYVHMGLSLLLLANLVTGALLFSIARQMGGRRAAWLVFLFWLANPYTVGLACTGVEAALATMMLTLSAWLSLRFVPTWTNQRDIPLRQPFLLGLSLGIACLCRTDSLFFALCLGSLILYRALQAQRPRFLALFGSFLAGGSLLILPWFGWNLYHFGTIVQDSARALTAPHHVYYFQKLGLSPLDTRLLQLQRALIYLKEGFGLPTVWLGPLLLAGGMLLILRLGHKATPHTDADTGDYAQSLCKATFFALTCLLGFYVAQFWFLQRWYFLGPTLCLLLLSARALALLEQKAQDTLSPRTQHAIFGVLLLLCSTSFFVQGRSLAQKGFYPWQVTYLKIAKQLAKSLPKDSRPAAFNAGIYGYFIDRRLVNLDGVVNPDALKAIKAHELFLYLRRIGVTHLIEELPVYLYFRRFAKTARSTHFLLLGKYKARGKDESIVVFHLLPLPKPRPPTPRRKKTNMHTPQKTHTPTSQKTVPPSSRKASAPCPSSQRTTYNSTKSK